MAFPDAQQLTDLLQPKLAERGLDVEDIKTTKAGKKSQVIIRIDGDKRPSSDVLEEVSNEISAFFDDKEAQGELNFGAGYTLEVSTPGVDCRSPPRATGAAIGGARSPLTLAMARLTRRALARLTTPPMP